MALKKKLSVIVKVSAFPMLVILPYHHHPKKYTYKNVLVVPDLKKNLISVSQLTKDDSCVFEFNSSRFKIKEQGWVGS